MALTAKSTEKKINDITHAWLKLRAGKSFSGMTLEQYQVAIKPSLDARADIAEAELRLQSSTARRAVVDESSLQIVRRIVNAVKSDPEEGEDGELYAAMGFVRRSDRSSGLTRRLRKGQPKQPETGGAMPKSEPAS